MALNKILLLALIITIGILSSGAKTAKSNKNRNNVKKIKNLKPNIYTEDYDSKTVALEFDEECLGDEKNVNDLMLKIMANYPCLSHKLDNNNTHHHGEIYRKYFEYNHDENKNEKCLEDSEIDWNEHCIHDISHDLIFKIESVCIGDVTNGIYYGTTKKPDAWSLDMLDSSTLDNVYKRPNVATDGNDHGVDIWILDSGIYSKHNEFYDGQIIDELVNKTYSGKHGTNAASVAGGANYGSSKGFHIHDYMVCGNSATGCAFSDIERGLLTAINHMETTGRRSVINLSMGSSGASNYPSTKSYYDSLFQDVITAGGILVNSAGNSNQDACDWWFSYSDHIVSVGAHDASRKKASFSNYGPCVDVYAPGAYVPAANSISDPTVIGLISGTSFSAPIMCGLIANLLYEDNTRTKDEIVSIIQTSANRYSISNCSTSCYGFYYKCSELTTNEFVENQITDDNNNSNRNGHCVSANVRNLGKVESYCQTLSLTDCVNEFNSQYCKIEYY